jgi:multimeric flavodoxin WrbA
MGNGDEWPSIRQEVLASDLVLIATPTWLGQPSSICQRVFERLDAELSETDDEVRLLTYGKVACAAVVGMRTGLITSVA